MVTTRHRPSRFADVVMARRTLRVGLCVARTLTEAGIDSLSLNADSRLKTMLAIVDLETRIAQDGKTAGVGTQASR